MEQPELFGGLPPAQKRKRLMQPDPKRQAVESRSGKSPGTLEQRWERFHRQHPQVFARAYELAMAKLDAGAERIGAKALWEELRGEFGVPMDNSFTSSLARKLQASHPRLRVAIETRQRRAM